MPEYFEFSFGLSDEGRDERSLKEPVTIDGRFVLRGSVDVIERSAAGDMLRVTDHKTGKNRSNRDLIIGGGAVLQPVLYSAAVEQGLGRRVVTGRLYYCTTAGGFAEHPIPINDYNRKVEAHNAKVISDYNARARDHNRRADAHNRQVIADLNCQLRSASSSRTRRARSPSSR